jgi:lipoprotein signal peptidase
VGRKSFLSDYDFTRFETKLLVAIFILVPLKVVVFLFNRADGVHAPDPASGRVYEIVVRNRGRTWSFWIDHAGWLINQVLTWPLYTAIVLLVASVAFHKYRAYWRSKHEGRPPTL